MFLFSAPLYDLLAAEFCAACAEGDSLSERVVELDAPGGELLFRFTPFRKRGRLGFGCYRMETWCGGVRVSNNFDADRLRRMLR